MKAFMTQEMYDSIPQLLAEGLDRQQIAERFGTTTASLQVQCCRRGISLRRADRPKLQKLRLDAMPIVLRDKRVLQMKAQALGMDEAKLASKLLNMIIRDDLFVAILDNNNRVMPVEEDA